MSRRVLAAVLAAAIGGGAIAVIAGAAARSAWPVTRVVTVTRRVPVTHVRTEVRTAIRWRTRTRKAYVSRPASVQCFEYGGKVYLSSPGAGVAATSCTVSVTPVFPLSAGQARIAVTAPDGGSVTFTVAS